MHVHLAPPCWPRILYASSCHVCSISLPHGGTSDMGGKSTAPPPPPENRPWIFGGGGLWRYSSTHSLTLVLHGGGWLTPRLGHFTPGGKSRPYRDFFVLCTSSVLLLCRDCPGCAFCPYCATHNTNIHPPAGIRTHNPSKRSAADPRLRPLGHWDRQIRFPNLPTRSESLYRLSYRGWWYSDERSWVVSEKYSSGMWRRISW